MISNCNILYASGYVEESVNQAITFLHKSGIQVAFVGLKAGSVAGASGTVSSPSTLISQLNGAEIEGVLPGSLLIAGGSACVQQLLADPRVHSLIHKMSLMVRPVGFLSPASYSLIERLNQSSSPTSYLLQEQPKDFLFLQQFVQQLSLLDALASKEQDPPMRQER